MRGVSEHSVADTQFIELSLDSVTTDGTVRFEDGSAAVNLTLNLGVFSNGDTVRLYKKGKTKTLKTVLISDSFVGSEDVSGEVSFSVMLPEEVFDEVTTLFVVYTPAGTASGKRGSSLEVIRDSEAPIITVDPLNSDSAQSKTVRANDDTDSETAWLYRIVSGKSRCDADTMTKGVRSYSEGRGLVFRKERANGYKICFSSTDEAGNTAYAASMVIKGIDSRLPVITITDPVAGPARSKSVRAADTEGNIVSWKYRQIGESAACDRNTMRSGSKSYTEGKKLVFGDENDNNTKVCFSAIDAAGNTSYVETEVIDGIDTAAPRITVTHPVPGFTRSKTISAVDANTASETVWKYRILKEGSFCDAKAMRTGTSVYRENSGLVFRKERANGYKVCFSSTDKAGNVSYAASRVMRGIDVDAPSSSGSDSNRYQSSGEKNTGKKVSENDSNESASEEYESVSDSENSDRPPSTASLLTPKSAILYPVTSSD